MNKRLAELLQKREQLRKEARELAEAVDVPAEELETKAEALAKSIAQIEAEIAAIKRLLEIGEQVDEQAASTESTGEQVMEEGGTSLAEDPAAPREEGRMQPYGSGARIIDARDRWVSRAQRKRERLRQLRIPRELREGFLHYLRTGQELPTFREAIRREAEQRAVVDTTQAGVLIPLYVESEVVTDISDILFMRRLATVRSIPGNINLPVIDGISRFSPVPENAEYPEVDIEFGGPTLRPLKIGGVTLISYEITRLAPHDVEAVVADAMAEGRAENEEEMFLVGSGTGEPMGLVTAATPQVTAASNALTAQDFIDLFYSLPLRYQANAVWVMNPATAAMLRGLEDSAGNPIWYPSLAGQPETLLGRPVYTSVYVPQIGPGNKSVIFGDLSEYIIGDREGMWLQVMREAYARRGQIGIQLTYFVDANIRRKRAIAAIQHAT